MNVLITGDPAFWSAPLIEEAVRKSGFHVTKLITGLGPGVEWGALRWAINLGKRTIGFDPTPYAKARNPKLAMLEDMVGHTDALILITSQRSTKVQRIHELAKKRGIPIFIYQFKKEDW